MQVTVEYLQRPDGSVEPTAVISAQHAGPSYRLQECEGYTGAEMVASRMEQMSKEITLQRIKLKNGQSAIINLYGSHTRLRVNPFGQCLAGRKIIASRLLLTPCKPL